MVCPPVEYDPHTGSPLTDLVAVGHEGVVRTSAWVRTVHEGQPLQQPHALALILLDGADTAMLHVVSALGSPDALSTGDRVRIRWAEERSGSICDIECFERVGGEQ